MGSLVLMCSKYSLLMYLTLIVCIISVGLVWIILDASAEKNPVNKTSEEKQRKSSARIHECRPKMWRRKVASSNHRRLGRPFATRSRIQRAMIWQAAESPRGHAHACAEPATLPLLSPAYVLPPGRALSSSGRPVQCRPAQ
jgi:hypothetical protein